MCAVCGSFEPEARPEILASRVDAMLPRLAHRGPDGSGRSEAPGIALGHARLSFVGGDSGRQPIVDGPLTLVCAGEIFNHAELRAEAEAKGFRFRTASDCEAVLYVYAQEGIAGFSRLNGQWAAAIWDARRSTLVLARDRFGIAPLHVFREGRAVHFASEIKAFFALSGFSPRPDEAAVGQWLRLWAPVPGRTFFEGVSEVMPGCALEIGARGEKETRYWEPRLTEIPHTDEEAAAERLAWLLDDAVRLRAAGTAERVGLYLSGGLDSAALASSAARSGKSGIEFFHVNVEGAGEDEEPYARLTARRNGRQLRTARFSPGEIARTADTAVWHAEAPFLRLGPLPFWKLGREAKLSGAKAVLTGEGADELLFGYDLFRETVLRERTRPGFTAARGLVRKLYPEVTALSGRPATPFWIETFFPQGSSPADPFFSHAVRWSKEAHLARYLAPEMRARLSAFDPLTALSAALPSDFASREAVDRGRAVEIAHWLPQFLLSSQGDRMAMAHSLETRPAYLDHRIAEFALGLPRRFHLRALKGKRLLARAFRARVPSEVLSRAKRPYRAPHAASTPEAAEAAARRLDASAVTRAGMFDAEAVSFLLKKALRTGGALSEIEGMALNAAFTWQSFHESFVERRAPAEAA